MSLAVSLLSLAGALAAGTVSPGPSFVMVARTSVAQSRAQGMMAALGMGAGGTLFAIAALFGLQVLLKAVPGLYLFLKVGGGAYLVYLGYRIGMGAKNDIAATACAHSGAGQNHLRTFWLALATQLSNPKCAIVYASVFAALLPPNLPVPVLASVPCVVFLIEGGWYGLVAVGLSAPAPRAAYLRYKTWIDRTSAGVIGALGVKLLASVAGE